MRRPEPQSFDRVLSSMCTEPHPAARKAAERFLATNPGDPATYDAIAALEERAVELLSTLAEHPNPDSATGYVTSGGTEANVQAVRSARNRHDGDDPNVVALSRTGRGELRVVCMPHVTRETLEAFVAELDRIRG